MRTRFLLVSAALGTSMLLVAATAWAASPVTRKLQQTINVPSGDSVAIENLAGYVKVVQGSGTLQVDATVVAGGDQAQALAQSVKLDVSTSGNRVLVHVHYPVDRHDTFLYSPPNTKAQGSDEFCILGKWMCFHGHSTSDVRYQGRRVRVEQSSGGGSGTPLYADIVVHLPAHVTAGVSNAVGLLQADHLADDLSLLTEGGDIHLQGLQGKLNASSGGGDIVLGNLVAPDASVATAGGDLTGKDLSGNLQLATGGGDAKLDTVSGKLSITSAGGDVGLSGNLTALHSLDAETGGGSLSVSGGRVSLQSLHADSSGGNINLAGVTAPVVELGTGGGDLVASGLNGDLSVSTAGGEVKLDNVGGQLSLTSGGGDVHLTGNLAALQSLHAQTSGGILSAAGNLAALTSLQVGSGGGDISLRANGLSLHLQASSSGGNIDVDLPDLRNVDSSSNHFSGDIGKAAGSATLDSDGGDITLRQP